MLYVFLSLFAAQFVLASPLMIRKEQTEDGVKTLFSEISKTASESTESKTHPFLTMEGQMASSEASSMGYNQAKCKRKNLVIVFTWGEGWFLREKIQEKKSSLV